MLKHWCCGLDNLIEKKLVLRKKFVYDKLKETLKRQVHLVKNEVRD